MKCSIKSLRVNGIMQTTYDGNQVEDDKHARFPGRYFLHAEINSGTLIRYFHLVYLGFFSSALPF